MNQSEFKPSFKGCVIIPLSDDDEDIARIRYHGDWLNKRTHGRIIKKPRKYQLTFYFKGFDGERGVEQVQILQKDNFMALADYIKTYGDEMINQIGKDKVDLKKSYVSIRA